MLRVISGGAAELIYLDASFNAASSSVYTFSGMDFGTARGARTIIVAAGASTQGDSISSVTIGGVTGTLALKNATGLLEMGLWYANVTGTSGDVVISISGNAVNGFAATWSAFNLKSRTPHHTGSHMATDPATVSLNIPANGIAAGFGWGDATANGNNTWTGVTENYDAVGEGTLRQTIATGSGMAEETGRTIRVDANFGRMNLVTASWG